MIKHGVRVKRGINRVPRAYLLRRVMQKPTMRPSLMTSKAVKAPAEQLASPAGSIGRDLNYRVAIVYSLQDGSERTFTGSFLARNAQAAEQAGRNFVIRFLRPQHIDDVVALPIV